MAIPIAPTNFLITPGAEINVASWDSVVDATSYNLYWKKDKCPNCYFTSLDDFTITTSDVGESTTIVDNKVKFDIVDGTDGKITAEYSYDISVGDFTCVIDIEDYVPDDSTRGIIFNFRAVGFRVAPGGAYIDFAQINFFASNTLGGYSFITNARFRVATVDDNKGEIGLNSYPSKLKITRVGDVLECFYYTDAWYSAGSKDFGSNSVNIHKIEFQITDWELNGGYAEADNLIVTPSVESSGTKITGVTSPYLHYPLTPDDVYCYEITAENVDGEGDASLEDFGMPEALLPPTNFSVVPGVIKNTVSWDSVVGATSYNLYWLIYNYYQELFADLSDWDIYKDVGTETVQLHLSQLEGSNFYAGNGWHVVRKTDIPSGDFEIQVDNTAYTPHQNDFGGYVYFKILDAYPFLLDRIEIRYHLSSGGTQHNVVSSLYVNGVNNPTVLTVAAIPTKYKAVRVGNTINIYYYISSWILIDSVDFGSRAGNLKIVTFDGSLNTGEGSIVRWDNLLYSVDVKTLGTKITGVTSPHEHTSLTPYENYNYVITSENISGESDVSLIASGIPENGPPTAPVIAGVYDALTDGDSQNTITISEIFNATIYNIYWSLTSGVTIANGTKIADVTSPYEHIDLTRQNYYYIATAENDEYESVISNEICLKPDFDGKIFNHNDIIISRLLYQYKIKE